MIQAAMRVPTGNLYTIKNDTEPTPPPPPPEPQDPVAALFEESVDRIVDYRNRAEAGEQGLAENLRAESSAVKQAFKQTLTSQTELPATLEQARALTLAAVQAGLMAGAMDGAILLAIDGTIGQPPSDPTDPGNPTGIPDFDEFLENLGEMWDQAKTAMKRLGVDAVKGASHYAKEGTGKLVEQSDAFVGSEKIPVEGFQAYLGSAFAAGYSVAGMDSLLVMEGDVPPEELKK